MSSDVPLEVLCFPEAQVTCACDFIGRPPKDWSKTLQLYIRKVCFMFRFHVSHELFLHMIWLVAISVTMPDETVLERFMVPPLVLALEEMISHPTSRECTDIWFEV